MQAPIFLLILVPLVLAFKLPVPSQDEWYSVPPEKWDSAPPGTVLRVRSNVYDISPRPISNTIDAVQAQFATTDSHGKPTYAVTTILIPESHASCLNTSTPQNCSHALISYQTPYDTSCVDASPSWSLQYGDPFGEITAALERGWFVSVPDYEGPRASFGANIIAGHIVLDSIRAALVAAGQFGFQNETGRAAIWGYSSGGTASEFALELAPTYAPDLSSRLVAASIGGVTANSTLSISYLNAKPGAAIFLQGIIGVATQYPGEWEYLNSTLKHEGPHNITEFYSARHMNGWDSLIHFANQDIYKYFKNGQADIDVPRMLEMGVKEGWIGLQGTPKIPIFIYHAANDTLCPINVLDAAVAKYCADGANILYHRNSLGDHNEELFKGKERTLDYLGWFFDGTEATIAKAPEKGCQWLNITLEGTGQTIQW